MTDFEQESLVYGVIRYQASASEQQAQAHRRVNARAIALLPTSVDDNWSLLCREMFAVPNGDLLSGVYHTQLVHFAASYRAVEYEWEQWLAQFERLIRQMHWQSATVHLETELSGKHTFHWHSDNGHDPQQSELQMRCQWERETDYV